MVIVITGARGLLGKYLIKTQPQKIYEGIGSAPEHEVIELNRQDMDVSNMPKVLEKLFQIRPDIIIHCAANGDVDDVEKNPGKAVQTDLLGTVNLMNYCEAVGCKLITLSSNAVYDGKQPPYSEFASRQPVNFYGKIKSLADDIIMKSSCEWLIVRPILLYGWGVVRDNWVMRIVRDLKQGKKLKLVTDSYTQPTYAGDLAEAIWHLIERDQWGESFNIAPRNKMSLYNFGLLVCEAFDLPKILIEKAKLGDFEYIAPRPIDTCFDSHRIERVGYKCNSITDGLKLMRDE